MPDLSDHALGTCGFMLPQMAWSTLEVITGQKIVLNESLFQIHFVCHLTAMGKICAVGLQCCLMVFLALGLMEGYCLFVLKGC